MIVKVKDYSLVPEAVIAGTSGSYGNERLEFSFEDGTWDGLAKTVWFYTSRKEYIEAHFLEDGKTVKIPEEITAKSGTYVYVLMGSDGKKASEDGRLKLSLTGSITVLSTLDKASAREGDSEERKAYFTEFISLINTLKGYVDEGRVEMRFSEESGFLEWKWEGASEWEELFDTNRLPGLEARFDGTTLFIRFPGGEEIGTDLKGERGYSIYAMGKDEIPSRYAGSEGAPYYHDIVPWDMYEVGDMLFYGGDSTVYKIVSKGYEHEELGLISFDLEAVAHIKGENGEKGDDGTRIKSYPLNFGRDCAVGDENSLDFGEEVPDARIGDIVIDSQDGGFWRLKSRATGEAQIAGDGFECVANLRSEKISELINDSGYLMYNPEKTVSDANSYDDFMWAKTCDTTAGLPEELPPEKLWGLICTLYENPERKTGTQFFFDSDWCLRQRQRYSGTWTAWSMIANPGNPSPYRVYISSADGASFTGEFSTYRKYRAGDVFALIPSSSAGTAVNASANPTLDINGLGAKGIRRRTRNGAAADVPASYFASGVPMLAVYDGARFVLNDVQPYGGSDFSQAIAVSKGGTGKISWTANRLIYPSSASAFAQLEPPAEAGVLTQGASGAPYFTALSGLNSGGGGTSSGGVTILSIDLQIFDFPPAEYSESSDTSAYSYYSTFGSDETVNVPASAAVFFVPNTAVDLPFIGAAISLIDYFGSGGNNAVSFTLKYKGDISQTINVSLGKVYAIY